MSTLYVLPFEMEDSTYQPHNARAVRQVFQ